MEVFLEQDAGRAWCGKSMRRGSIPAGVLLRLLDFLKGLDNFGEALRPCISSVTWKRLSWCSTTRSPCLKSPGITSCSSVERMKKAIRQLYGYTRGLMEARMNLKSTSLLAMVK